MFGRRCCNRQQGMFNQSMGMPNACCMETEVIEPTITKCVEKEIYHEVPHVCPIHTHVINRHIYKHTYTPQYTCSEEDQVCNIDCGKCSGFANN
jgi:hypothetical protein